MPRQPSSPLGRLTASPPLWFSPSPLPGVQYLLARRASPRAPVLYEPSIIILAIGRKQAYLGNTVHSLDPGCYWVVSVPLPFACETEASPGAPLYGLSIQVDPGMPGELLLEMDDDRKEVTVPAGLSASPMTGEIAAAAARPAEAGITAGDAAARVGYGSPSQFSRKFKRLFGASPSEEAAQLKGTAG